MTAVLQVTSLNYLLWMKIGCRLVQIALKFVSKGPFNNKPASIQVMAWCWTGDEPLSEPMMAKFTDAYIYWLFFYLFSFIHIFFVDCILNKTMGYNLLTKPLFLIKLSWDGSRFLCQNKGHHQQRYWLSLTQELKIIFTRTGACFSSLKKCFRKNSLQDPMARG